jgi:tRNA(Ile)-lysidine synthase
MPKQRALDDGATLVRPMLAFWKRDIVAYCKAAGFAFREDDTNHDPEAATRNRIRHVLVPLIERAINPQVGRALVQLAEQAARTQEVIRSEATNALDSCITQSTEDEWTIDVTSLSNLPRAVRSELLRVVIERSGAAMQSIGYERIEAAAELIDGDGQSRRVEMAGGVTIERRGGKLVVQVGEARPGRDNLDNHRIQEACR